MTRASLPDGVFPSVALSGGVGTLTLRVGDPRAAGDVVVWRFPVADPDALTELARVALPAGSPCFPGLYVLDGLTWWAFHDGQRQRLRVLETGRDVLAVAGLSNPSAFGAGCFAYTEPVQPYRVHRLDLRTAATDQPRLGAPTGLSRIDWRGDVVTIDEDRYALPGATIPSFAGIQLAVGEGPTGGAIWVSYPDTNKQQRGTLYAGLDSFTPKCAADGDTLAITAGGSGSVRLFCGTLAALIAASISQLPSPKPPIVREPGPINTEKESPVSVPDHSAFVRSFLSPRLRNMGSKDATRRHTFVNGVRPCVAELAKSDPNCGLLDKPAGDNVEGFAADILLYNLGNGTAQVIDIVGDAEGAGPKDDGTGTPVPSWGLSDIRLMSQWRPAGAAAQPGPGPVTPPPVETPPVDTRPSLDRWLHVELPQLRAAFEQTHAGVATPDDWYAFQTFRRYGPELWSFERMLAHERAQ